jgi:hypothetical protein
VNVTAFEVFVEPLTVTEVVPGAMLGTVHMMLEVLQPAVTATVVPNHTFQEPPPVPRLTPEMVTLVPGNPWSGVRLVIVRDGPEAFLPAGLTSVPGGPWAGAVTVRALSVLATLPRAGAQTGFPAAYPAAAGEAATPNRSKYPSATSVSLLIIVSLPLPAPSGQLQLTTSQDVADVRQRFTVRRFTLLAPAAVITVTSTLPTEAVRGTRQVMLVSPHAR